MFGNGQHLDTFLCPRPNRQAHASHRKYSAKSTGSSAVFSSPQTVNTELSLVRFQHLHNLWGGRQELELGAEPMGAVVQEDEHPQAAGVDAAYAGKVEDNVALAQLTEHGIPQRREVFSDNDPPGTVHHCGRASPFQIDVQHLVPPQFSILSGYENLSLRVHLNRIVARSGSNDGRFRGEDVSGANKVIAAHSVLQRDDVNTGSYLR